MAGFKSIELIQVQIKNVKSQTDSDYLPLQQDGDAGGERLGLLERVSREDAAALRAGRVSRVVEYGAHHVPQQPARFRVDPRRRLVQQHRLTTTQKAREEQHLKGEIFLKYKVMIPLLPTKIFPMIFLNLLFLPV